MSWVGGKEEGAGVEEFGAPIERGDGEVSGVWEGFDDVVEDEYELDEEEKKR